MTDSDSDTPDAASLTPSDLDEAFVAVIDRQRGQFESGNRFALFVAIDLCLEFHVLPPDWAVAAFGQGVWRYKHRRVSTLDEAFELKRQRTGRYTDVLSLEISLMVSEYRERGASVTDALFEEIGKELNLSGSTVKSYYYRAKKEASTGEETRRSPKP